MDVDGAVGAILHTAETQPPHAYWHGLASERAVLARDPARAGALLAPALGHASRDVRRFVARVLCELGQADVLRRALADADDEVRYEACHGVLGVAVGAAHAYGRTIRVEPAVRAEVLAALRSFTATKPYIAAGVIQLRVRLADPELLAFSRTHARDPQWHELYNALARIPGGGPRVLELTRDPDPWVRQRACVALYEPFVDLDPAEAIAALVERLADPECRSTAATALGSLGAREAERHLLEHLGDTADAGVITTLARWQSQAALPQLLALAITGNTVAIDALERYPGSAAIEDALLAVLASAADLDVRRHAAEVLSHQGSVTSVPALEQFVEHDARGLTKRYRKEAQRRLPVRIAQLRERPPWPR